MYHFIEDENELMRFFREILPPLKNDEVYFVSLSARNKYLTEEERQRLGLGRTEMFERRIIRYYNWERFLRTLKKFETNEGSYRTKKGMNIPNDIITIYININPSSSLKAYNKFSKTMNDYLFELSQCTLKQQDLENILTRINKQDTLLMNCYQQSRGTKHYIDIDIDIDKKYFPLVEEIYNRFSYGYIIETKSGYHWLLPSNAPFSKEKNPKTLIKEIQLKFGVEEINTKEYEIVINKNEMIPIPGTLQAGFLVKIVKG